MFVSSIRIWINEPLVQILLATMLGGIGQSLIKHGVSQVGVITGLNFKMWQALLSPSVLSGFASYGISSLLYLMVVSKKGLSFAYPFVALNQVIVFLLAWLLFRESISLVRFIGIVVICVGVVFIAMGK